MTAPTKVRTAGGAALLLAAVALGALPTGLSAQEAQGGSASNSGKAVYDKWCSGCHGEDGKGDGPGAAFMLPRPRDFTKGVFQIRTTASGQLPTDDDLMRVIDRGMGGTAMPAWQDVLSQGERNAVLDYIKGLSPFFANSPAPKPLDFGKTPSGGADRVAEGKQVFQKVECYRCHGNEGRGNGTSAPTLQDDNDRPIRAADLTQGWRFNGGGTVEDIYHRMRTGLDGTPMPSQSDLVQSGVITNDQLWSLAYYVRSLSPEQNPPPVRDVIQADLVPNGGSVPTTADDQRWNDVDRFYIPLVGQVIAKQRWFDPRVSTVWVQALHDDKEVALRLSWDDPSQSPDSAWSDWQTQELALMEPTADDSVKPGPRPDRIAVQFPTKMPEGNERPYFLMGDGGHPVNLWNWTSTDGAQLLEARGITSQTPAEKSEQDLTADAKYEDGQWTLLLRRPLQAADSTKEISFGVDQMIPVAFFAWDGDNGEDGTRGAISTWYYLHLGTAPSANVYVAPLAAMAITALLGVGVVAQAQKRDARGEGGAGEPAGSGGGVPPFAGGEAFEEED